MSSGHRTTTRSGGFREEGKLPASEVGEGEGFVQFVDGAFGDRNAMAVGGATKRGSRR